MYIFNWCLDKTYISRLNGVQIAVELDCFNPNHQGEQAVILPPLDNTNNPLNIQLFQVLEQLNSINYEQLPLVLFPKVVRNQPQSDKLWSMVAGKLKENVVQLVDFHPINDRSHTNPKLLLKNRHRVALYYDSQCHDFYIKLAEDYPDRIVILVPNNHNKYFRQLVANKKFFHAIITTAWLQWSDKDVLAWSDFEGKLVLKKTSELPFLFSYEQQFLRNAFAIEQMGDKYIISKEYMDDTRKFVNIFMDFEDVSLHHSVKFSHYEAKLLAKLSGDDRLSEMVDFLTAIFPNASAQRNAMGIGRHIITNNVDVWIGGPYRKVFIFDVPKYFYRHTILDYQEIIQALDDMAKHFGASEYDLIHNHSAGFKYRIYFGN